MSDSIYNEPRDIKGKGNWWQMATPEGFCYTFRHEDGYYHCICAEHTAENPFRFKDAKSMEGHLRGKNNKSAMWPYRGHGHVIPYTVCYTLFYFPSLTALITFKGGGTENH